VLSGSAVKVRNGAACGSFAAPGAGRYLNEGSVVDWLAEATPDGGVPAYSCCGQTAGAVWQLCRQAQ
jgi:hypothetical protein